jgi:flagellar hook protein FlgE
MSFEQGLSGLNAATKSLDVIGNNIANANAAGFKTAVAQFADVYANSQAGAGSTAVGIGAQLAAIAPQFSQGNITTTKNPLDVAINGPGFFRMNDNGAIAYSRDGEFHLDKSGYVVNSGGNRLTGYTVDPNGNIVPSSPVDLQLSSAAIPPLPTSKVDATLSLDARATVPLTPVFNPTDPTTYNNSTSVSVFDSLGNPHVMSLYFVKTAAANTWDINANVDGTPVANIDIGAGPGNPLPLTFNGSGAMTSAMPTNVSINLNGVAAALGTTNGATSPLSMTLNLTGTTQFGTAFGVNSMDQDGYGSGRLSGVGISADGVIQGNYSNGQAKNLGQIVLVNFNNDQGLRAMGRNLWGETPDSGVPLTGVPGSGSLGVLQASAIEDSNVDLTAELVNMITMQRVYQANAQSIKTQDAVLQTLVNLR